MNEKMLEYKISELSELLLNLNSKMILMSNELSYAKKELEILKGKCNIKEKEEKNIKGEEDYGKSRI